MRAANTIMDTSSSFSTVLNVMHVEKEIFWLENKDLTPDELQRQWAHKTAEFNAVLGPAAPTHRLDLDLKTSGPQEMQQCSTVPRAIPQLAWPCSVWFPIPLLCRSGLTLALGQPSHLRA